MKSIISALTIAFFLTTIVFAQEQVKQEVKKDVKVEKIHKNDSECSTNKASDKTQKESCDKEKNESQNEDDCCKTEKSTIKSKESKN